MTRPTAAAARLDNPTWVRAWLVVVIGLFLALGVIYSLVTPVLEASDEISHYPVVQHIQNGRGLPVQDPGVESLWHQEGSQPPLYYAAAAALTSWIDTTDLPDVVLRNPMASIGKPLVPGNKNMIIHTEREAFPWRGSTLAIHLIRFFSLLLQTVTVYLTYRLVLEIAPDRRETALAAATLVAFNPMLLFIAGSVNNDNLVVPLCTLAFWLLARTWRQGWLPAGRLLLLGVVLGAAALTKLSGLALLALSAAVLLCVAARRRAWKALVIWGATLIVLAVAIAGWWYYRNWQLYGDPTGLNMMVQIAGRRPATWMPAHLLREFEGFRMSFWAVFGGFNIVAWRWLYRVYDALVLLAVAGWIVALLRRRLRFDRPGAGIIVMSVAWILLIFVALVRWTSQTAASQGRLLFPAIAAVAVLLVFGWGAWFPDRWRGWALAGISGAMLVVAAILPFAVIVPAYARPPLLTEAEIPASASRTDVLHGGVMRMVGYELPAATVRPGEYLPVSVYWQVAAKTDRDLSVFVHLLGRNYEVAGELGTYPGVGAYATSQLPTGAVLADRYQVPVAVSATAPSLLRVDVGCFELGTAETGLSAVKPDGTQANPVLGMVRLLPYGPPSYDIPEPLRFTLGDDILLLGYDLPVAAVPRGSTLALKLYWQAQVRVTGDYHVLVHLVGEDGLPAAQGDKAPLDGDWPTWAWEPGYPIEDEYSVAVPEGLAPGVYRLAVGLYRVSDFWRLPVKESDERVRDSAIILGEVQVQ